ncbi:MAG: alpha/beta fold hydrolase [Leptospiraceae bacterium]|nr:alpha/beta fold hydrolase [Leptospiraceae bacterium]
MKTTLGGALCTAVITLFAVHAPLMASGGGSAAKPLDGTHPIVLSHGLFGWGEDSNGVVSIANYWGGMDDYLRSEGASVYAPTKSALGSNEDRAAQMKSKILYWMAANGYSKVHVIGHSQGGLDSRYMIANLGMAAKVSSLTTLSTPHRGSPVADIVETVLPNWLEPFVADVLEALTRLVWSGSQQDGLNAMNALTTSGLSQFNQYTPNASSVKYISWAAKMAWADPIQHPLMWLTHPACWAGGVASAVHSSANDGLVPVSSSKWGTYKGEVSHSWYATGLDHLQISNTMYSGNAYYDVEGFYLRIAQDAKAVQ